MQGLVSKNRSYSFVKQVHEVKYKGGLHQVQGPWGPTRAATPVIRTIKEKKRKGIEKRKERHSFQKPGGRIIEGIRGGERNKGP